MTVHQFIREGYGVAHSHEAQKSSPTLRMLEKNITTVEALPCKALA